MHPYKAFKLIFQVLLSFDDYFFHILASLSSHLVPDLDEAKQLWTTVEPKVGCLLRSDGVLFYASEI